MNNSSEQDILTDAGRASAQLAKDLAESEFEKYQTRQRQIEVDIANEELNRTVKGIMDKDEGRRMKDEIGLKRLPNMLIWHRSYVTGCNCANTYWEAFPNKLLHFNRLFMFRYVIQARKT